MPVALLPCISGSVCSSASCLAPIAPEWVQHNLYAQSSQTLRLTVTLGGLFMAHSLVFTIKLLTVLPVCLQQNHHLQPTKLSVVFNNTLRHEFSTQCSKSCPSIPLGRTEEFLAHPACLYSWEEPLCYLLSLSSRCETSTLLVSWGSDNWG